MKQYKLLIVDDDLISQQLLQHVLTELGHTVVGVATSGEEAHLKTVNLMPDVVIMDIRLPGKWDGIETNIEIQKSVEVPVIYITNFEDHVVFEKALATNPSGYIVKPFDRHNLIVIIEMAVHRYQLEKQLHLAKSELQNYNQHLEEKVEQRTQELDQKNKQLERALNKEKELNEYRAKIVTTVSHEFKTPLTTISSSTELMERMIEKPNFADKAKRHLTMIGRSVDIINRLLKNVTKHRELEQKETCVSKEIVVQDFFERFVDYFKEGIAKNHHIVFSNAFAPVLIYTDDNLLWEVCSNLVSNAVKYSDQNTKIDIILKEENSNLRCEVTDQGQGIRPEDKDKLFDYFFRSSINENIEGSGVGLNIVKRALELMRGSITVESEFGKGASFAFEIPVK